jgi:tetratricopeptide (TPR) repeat protein
MPDAKEKKHFWQQYPNTTGWLAVALTTLVWLWVTAQESRQRFVLLLSLALASFMVGTLVGFLLTSYGEETGTIGKVRDWLVGGVVGITVANITPLKGILLTFCSAPGPIEFALTLSTAIVGGTLGFFFMFFAREFIFNVQLAKKRAERGRVEGTRQAGVVTQELLLALPASILSGIDDIDEIIQFRQGEAEKLRGMLYSDDVQRFIQGADDAAKSGNPLDWDVVSKAAALHYYRMYFEKGDEKVTQAEAAHQWIVRALTMNPLHVDLTVKLADTLGIMDRYEEAVAVLERLGRSTDAPAYIKQWLGYFLLNVNRLDDAIKYSEEYHAAFPDESDALFNIAYAYAQKYCDELRTAGKDSLPASQNRASALSRLQEALRGQPEYAETVRTKWTTKGEAFNCLLRDPDFIALVGDRDAKATGASGATLLATKETK